MKEFWNERFAQDEFIYGTSPNEFFAQQLELIPRGSLLLPAEGEGRNAVYAAKKGFEVSAFDFSEEGKAKALELANTHNVNIRYDLLHASGFQKDKHYDVVALIYAHFAGEERIDLFKKLESSLETGGHLIMEVFSKNQLGRTSGGPKSLELLYNVEEVKSLFPTISFSMLEESTVTLKEGKYHCGEAKVIRAIGQKMQ